MVNFLIVLVLVLAVIAIAQLARVYEISSILRKKKEEDVSDRDNKLNAGLMIIFMVLFYAGFIWLMVVYGDGGLPVAASEHGAALDSLLSFNWVIIITVFFLTNTLLFVFVAKYYGKKGRKAHWFPHDNKLELIWTVVPAVVLAVIIIFGLRTWQEITGDNADKNNPLTIELYSKQFDWTARYGGVDTTAKKDTVMYQALGDANYLLITTQNPLGIITPKAIEISMASYQEKIDGMNDELAYNDTLDMYSVMVAEVNRVKLASYIKAGHGHSDDHGHDEEHGDGHDDGHGGDHGGHGDGHGEGHGDGHGGGHGESTGWHFDFSGMSDDELAHKLAEANMWLNAHKDKVVSFTGRAEREEKVARYKRFMGKLYQMKVRCEAGDYENGSDDIVTTGEFYIPKGKEVNFQFRSRDVLHSAYMPHFRAQMNTVPGMTTPFRFTATMTTEEMREETNDEEFDYLLLCNKICGSNHFNMQIKIVVVEQDEFDAWLKTKSATTFGVSIADDEDDADTSEEGATTEVAEVNAGADVVEVDDNEAH